MSNSPERFQKRSKETSYKPWEEHGEPTGGWDDIRAKYKDKPMDGPPIPEFRPGTRREVRPPNVDPEFAMIKNYTEKLLQIEADMQRLYDRAHDPWNMFSGYTKEQRDKDLDVLYSLDEHSQHYRDIVSDYYGEDWESLKSRWETEMNQGYATTEDLEESEAQWKSRRNAIPSTSPMDNMLRAGIDAGLTGSKVKDAAKNWNKPVPHRELRNWSYDPITGEKIPISIEDMKRLQKEGYFDKQHQEAVAWQEEVQRRKALESVETGLNLTTPLGWMKEFFKMTDQWDMFGEDVGDAKRKLLGE